jgi:tetratricopeptide (TPR) repeat protein
MADARLPILSPEHRRIAAERFDRARQVITTGNLDYGLQLLLTCCKLDPGNLIYRQELRRAQKTKHGNNLRGGFFAFLTSAPHRTKLKSAKRSRDHLKVLEHGEQILMRNPWDLGAQMDMADAADALGKLDLAIYILDQAREKDGNNPTLNRALARLFEKRGNFAQAIKLWELVRQVVPSDAEATHKAKDLAASETIQRGHYEDAMAAEEPVRVVQQAKASAAASKSAHDLEVLKGKIESEPTSATPYLQLAAHYRKHHKDDDALTILQQGLGATGQDFEIQVAIAELELEPFQKNLALADEKLKSTPKDENLRTIRGRLLKEINARELELFRMKADRQPTDLGLRLELGVRLLRAGQTDEAIAELQNVRKDPRNLGRAAMYLGFGFKARNNWRLAQRNFEEALKSLLPTAEAERKEVLFQLANGHAEAGDFSQAVDFGHELANLDFGYRDIGRLIDDWQSRLQKA